MVALRVTARRLEPCLDNTTSRAFCPPFFTTLFTLQDPAMTRNLTAMLAGICLLSGCAGMNTDFDCQSLAHDRCLTMEDANQIARHLPEKGKPAYRRSLTCHRQSHFRPIPTYWQAREGIHHAGQTLSWPQTRRPARGSPSEPARLLRACGLRPGWMRKTFIMPRLLSHSLRYLTTGWGTENDPL